MKKLIIIGVLIVIVVTSFLVSFWPKEESLSTKLYVKDTGLNDKNFYEYVTTFPGKRVYFFCSYNNDSCNYVNNTILKTIAENLLVDELDNIIFVDLSNASSSAVAKFQRQWHFSQYPAFVIIESTTSGYEVVDALGFSQDKPFDSTDLKNWLIDNGIWHVWLGLEPPPPKVKPDTSLPQPDLFPPNTQEPTKPKPEVKPPVITPEPDADPDPDPDPEPPGGE